MEEDQRQVKVRKLKQIISNLEEEKIDQALVILEGLEQSENVILPDL